MIKRQWDEPPWKDTGDVKVTPFSIEFWCGKISRYLRQEPESFDEKTEKRLDKEKSEIEKNPWPMCKKCWSKKKKTKAIQ